MKLPTLSKKDWKFDNNLDPEEGAFHDFVSGRLEPPHVSQKAKSETNEPETRKRKFMSQRGHTRQPNSACGLRLVE